MVVHLGEAQVFKRQVAQPLQRGVDSGGSLAYVFQQCPQLFFVHVRLQKVGRSSGIVRRQEQAEEWRMLQLGLGAIGTGARVVRLAIFSFILRNVRKTRT